MDDPATKHRRAVVALGGNALLRRGEPVEAANQAHAARDAARILARASLTHQLVITHGNGPQVGLLALMSDAYKETAPYPLDVLDAETEGQIGYVLEMQLDNFIDHQDTVTVITRIVVDADDPAFESPSKFIGPVYTDAEASEAADVDAVYDGDLPIAHATPDGLRTRRYPAGSMGPKVAAACRFVERTGGTAAIGSLDEIEQILDGRAGTQVNATGPRLEYDGGRRARVA